MQRLVTKPVRKRYFNLFSFVKLKEEYMFFGGLLLLHIGYLVYFFYRKWKYKQADFEIADFRYQSYLQLRQQTFAAKPGDLGITLPSNKEKAFGIVMEIHTKSELQAIVAFSSGLVWAFNTKNGRKNILGENNTRVAKAAVEAVSAAQYHFARMRRNSTGDLLPGHIKFHILTNDDIYSADGHIRDVIEDGSQWKQLFEKVNEVIVHETSTTKLRPLNMLD